MTKGTKKLTFPQLSRSFAWNGPEVISASSQGCLYILAKTKPLSKSNMSDSSDDESDEEFEVWSASN